MAALESPLGRAEPGPQGVELLGSFQALGGKYGLQFADLATEAVTVLFDGSRFGFGPLDPSRRR